MNEIRTCAAENSDDFSPCLLSVEKVAKLRDNATKDICFT